MWQNKRMNFHKALKTQILVIDKSMTFGWLKDWPQNGSRMNKFAELKLYHQINGYELFFFIQFILKLTVAIFNK